MTPSRPHCRTNAAGAALLAGWALYITMVAASNLTDLFRSFHWENWAFRSGNLAYIATATRIYFTTEQANQALLALVIAWEGVAAVLLWLAALRWTRGGEAALIRARHGLVTLGLLWFGFAISTELFVAYDRGVNESAYWILATAVLATVAVLEIWAPGRRDGAGVRPDLRALGVSRVRGMGPYTLYSPNDWRCPLMPGEPRSGQTLDAKAIVIDPLVPADIRREIAQAPMQRLVPFGAAPPEVVPVPRRRGRRVFTPQGRKAVKTMVAMTAFLAATITSYVLAALHQNGALGIFGFVIMIGWINRFIAAGAAFDAARAAGWRQPRPQADPGHPAWDGLHAVTAYHRRYVSPIRDMDARAREVWVRAVGTAAELRESEVVRLGLVDSVQVTTVLPYHLWDIAERLARLSALRMQHTAILRGVDADDPDVAALLAPQQRAQEAAVTDIEQRVGQLEFFTELVGQADAARRRERAVRRLATLNDSHVELLAHIGQNTGDDALTEQMTVDVQAIINQADEAVRQANEVGRSLVLPQRQGLEQARSTPG